MKWHRAKQSAFGSIEIVSDFDHDLYDAFGRMYSEPTVVFSLVWPLYLACPPGRHEQVAGLAVQVIDSNCNLEDLERTFASSIGTRAPDSEVVAASCYWKIVHLSGEALLKRARIEGRSDVTDRWLATFRDSLNAAPDFFRIPRMAGYAEGTESP